MNGTWSTDRNKAVILIGVYLIAAIVFTFVFHGTGDEGDSITHYFFSRYAFDYPEHFFNHWAKPLFVLLTCIPAQFGMDGMKIFNSFCMAGASWYAYKMAEQLSIPKPWLIPLLVICTPMSFSHTLSGLTEPLFAFWLTWSLWLILSKKELIGCLILSFLPFIRSEGMIMICTILPFLIWHKKWLTLPLLGVGHVVYALVGSFFYNDILWVFNRIPYATLEGYYGSGNLFHFFQYFDQVASLPVIVLLVIGLLSGLRRLVFLWISKIKVAISSEELWLVYGVFSSFFVAHTLFWYLGIFNSYGLTRVFLGVIPIMAIITLRGLQDVSWTYASFSDNIKRFALLSICIVLVSFLIWDLSDNRSLEKNDMQIAISEVLLPYKERYKNHTLYSDAPYAAFLMDRDWFDIGHRKRLATLYNGETIPTNSIVVWDDAFGAGESRVSLDQLMDDPRLTFIDSTTSSINKFNYVRSAALFEVQDAYTQNYTLYQENFDNSSDLAALDTAHYYSPPYAQKIHQSNIYSTGPEFFLGGLRAEPDRKLKVSAMVYYNPLDSDLSMPGYLVISHESNYKSFNWNAIPLSSFGKPGKWVEVKAESETLPYFTIEDRVKIYFINDQLLPIYVDDIKVVWTH